MFQSLMLSEDKTILKKIKKGDEKAFRSLFEVYYTHLFRFALTFLNKREIAEEIVQDVFISFWNNRHNLEIKLSIKSYLFKSVKNKSISYLRQQIDIIDSINENNYQNDNFKLFNTPDLIIETIELENLIFKAVSLLPEKCKIIFNLSRNSGLTYTEIAKELNISAETVKTQISIALKKIKIYLEIYWEAAYN